MPNSVRTSPTHRIYRPKSLGPEHKGVYKPAGVGKCPKCQSGMFYRDLFRGTYRVPTLYCPMCGEYIHRFRIDIKPKPRKRRT